MRSPPGRGAVVVAAAVAVAGVAAFAGCLYGGWGGEHVTRAVDDLALLAVTVFAAACAAWTAAASRGRHRWAWATMSAGLGLWATGETIWTMYELVLGRAQAPFPSVADAFFLAFPVAAGVTLWLLPAPVQHTFRARAVLDGVILAGSMFILSWLWVLSAVYRAAAESTMALAVSLAYPAGDVVLVSLAGLLLTRTRRDRVVPHALVTAAIVLICVADSWFAYRTATTPYQTGELIDVAWAAGFLLLGLAALTDTARVRSGGPSDAAAPGRLTMWLPYLPLLVLAGAGARQVVTMVSSGPVPPAVAVVVAALLGRQLFALSDNRRLLQQAAHSATHDQLTGLANRRLFSDCLDRSLARAQSSDVPDVTVLLLDLDDFKSVNDEFGHAVGDQLLTAVTDRICRVLRAGDLLARLGGDELAALVHADQTVAAQVARRIHDTVEQRPFKVHGHTVTTSVSIGLASADSLDRSHDLTGQALLELADQDMYRHKRARNPAAEPSQPHRANSRPAIDAPAPPPG